MDQEVLMEHQPSFEALATSAQHDCKLCSLLFNHLLSHRSCEQKIPKSEADAHERRCDEEPESNFIILPIKHYFQARDSPVKTGCIGFYYERESHTRWRTGAPNPMSIELKILPGVYDHPALVSRPITPLPDFERCAQWISHCLSRHPACLKPEARPLPTRLLDVGSEDVNPKLVVTRGRRGQYVALSHCWGTSNPPVTSLASYDEFLRCVPFASLPRTFRDAIATVRKLGYQYLWIDCFCIIQGDEKDFQYECSCMHATFENAVCTIAGPAAANAEAGFLHERQTWETDEQCEVMCFTQDENVGTVMVCPLREPTYIKEVQDWEGVLATRAWVLQERLLSSRVLYFGSTLMYFECNSSDCYETLRYPTYPNGAPEAGENLGGRDLIKHAMSPLHNSDPLETWFWIIVAYTSCNLTEESDKLPALSGLASRLYDATSDQYVVGMWRSRLWRQLCWYSGTKMKVKKSARPAMVSAPSWSWTSCDYALGYSNDISGHPERIKCRVTIDAVEVKQAGSDPFGQVSSGRLTITARSRQVLVRDNPSPLRNMHPLALCASIEDQRPLSRYFTDVPLVIVGDGLQSHDRLTCVLFGVSKRDQQWYGLVLKELPDQPGVFKRVGYTESQYSKHWVDAVEGLAWLEAGEEVTVHIV